MNMVTIGIRGLIKLGPTFLPTYLLTTYLPMLYLPIHLLMGTYLFNHGVPIYLFTHGLAIYTYLPMEYLSIYYLFTYPFPM
jgi:hypothetical protein